MQLNYAKEAQQNGIMKFCLKMLQKDFKAVPNTIHPENIEIGIEMGKNKEKYQKNLGTLLPLLL